MQVTMEIKEFPLSGLLIPRRLRSRNVRIRFWTISGEVTSSEKRSETHVYGSTSGSVYQGAGVVHGHVSSDVVLHHEFWVRTADGKEEEFKLTNIDIPLHKGQQVTVVLATLEGSNTGYVVAIANHSARKYWAFGAKYLYSKLYKFFPISGIRDFLVIPFMYFLLVLGLRFGFDLMGWEPPKDFMAFSSLYFFPLCFWVIVQSVRLKKYSGKEYRELERWVHEAAEKALQAGPQGTLSDEKKT